MIKTILLFLFIIVLAWLAQDYFNTTLPKHHSKSILPTNIKNKTIHVKKIQSKKIESKSKIKRSIANEQHIDKLAFLLKENKFYDALSFYLEHNTPKKMIQIETYLAKLAKSNPQLALKYMQIFLDNEPQSAIAKLMIKTYIEENNYSKAIALIIQLKENYISENEDKKLATQLRETSLKHIDALIKRKEYTSLISFLEEMIAYDSTDNFYTFRLAQLYMELDKTSEASILLETLKYDEVYAQNVKSLMDELDKDEEDSYEYSIPLEKYGEHYVVNVFLDNTAFRLMLDTGASYIFLDEEKSSMFEVIRDDLTLQTAGNDISAKLCNVSSMQMGNLELSNIQVTTSSFKRNGIDGLLGMNFFKRFIFFINQDENILYLNPK